ncbi:hypothetical protein K0T92_24075 [Paenibacillus oenotherae]|uniref:Uncharacterized protein n=1 Tax=Paenibacillus oenotherae TaxID=1435645 RepID=A0ABS7DE72_9BACL|nr:hypothetical protein [Paenibacillus oenotherae]MBW7477792.1 hypothetical protein [Paenibacillus oenotherae]
MSNAIIIHHYGLQPVETTPEEMASIAGGVFPLSERIEKGVGEAFDFHAWYLAWRNSKGIGADVPMPSQLKVEAADTFEAVIPWEQLEDSAVQFRIDHAPLAKGGPIRLYVPNGSSECLNVKSVVACRFIYNEETRGEVSYGFKNTFSPQEMRLKR